MFAAVGNCWDYDIREMTEASSNLWLAPGEEANLLLGGSVGTGGQWMYKFTNNFVLKLEDHTYTHEPIGEGATGGPFQLKLKLQGLV